jgi:hypothetical protein
MVYLDGWLFGFDLTKKSTSSHPPLSAKIPSPQSTMTLVPSKRFVVGEPVNGLWPRSQHKPEAYFECNFLVR